MQSTDNQNHRSLLLMTLCLADPYLASTHAIKKTGKRWMGTLGHGQKFKDGYGIRLRMDTHRWEGYWAKD